MWSGVYDRRVTTLPASVRVALWASAAYAGRLALEDVPGRALPDLDHHEGLVERLALWRDVGEQIVLVALPRPGDLTGMPRGSAALVAAATEAEELVYVPGVGGALVPVIERYGPPGDQGWQSRWRPFDADPVPEHVVQAAALPEAELRLRQEVARLTGQLTEADRVPLSGHGLEGRARRVLEDDWALPEGLPPRAVRVVELAGSVSALADSGLHPRLQVADGHGTLQRERILQELRDRASAALVAATNVAAMHLVGWR